MKENFEFTLMGWVDGELPEAEARQVEREIADDAKAGRLAEELRAVKSAMADGEMLRTVPDSREFYWSQIERQIRREESAVPARQQKSWPGWLSPVAGFASLACILLMAFRPTAAPTFDDIAFSGEGMEAVTFHDQAAGMTVIWLNDADQAQLIETPRVEVADPGESEIEM